MATRMIDRNAHRWGAGISAVVLLIGYALDLRAAVPVIGAALGVGVFFGLRYSPLGGTYRFVKRTLKLDVPTVPEEEPPPRFAQLMGFAMLGIGTIGFYALDSRAIGWTFGLIVAALQTLLATTGICVGCEMYLFGKRLSARSAA
jgi:uncharacterized protein DUF4395